MTVSICTIAKGRAGHLVNMIHGLNAGRQLPEEVVIAVMQAEPYDLPACKFPVRQLPMATETIPLASARNAAAVAATGETLIFLDVDCIPDPTLVADYARYLDRTDAVLMGEVAYLPAGATGQGLDFSRFAAIGVRHFERAGPPEDELGACSDYRCFWSLNFAVRRKTYLHIGGFDESYVGYGGEDTDFGRTVVTSGVPIQWCRGARAYHQYHSHHMPPVHHIDSVIANATRFRDKWGHFTMDHWLRAFTLMGLVALQDGRYVRLREVTEADLALTRQQSDQPYASSATVLTALEARAPSIAAT